MVLRCIDSIRKLASCKYSSRWEKSLLIRKQLLSCKMQSQSMTLSLSRLCPKPSSVVVLRSFLKIEELKLSMNLIYYRNITPNSQALGNGIFTSVDRGTHQARKRVVSAIHWMTVTYNKPTARMMRCLRSRLYSIQPIHSMFFNRIIFNPLISFLFSFISIG